MTIEGISAGGYTTVGQMNGTNRTRFHAKQSALAIAIELHLFDIWAKPVITNTARRRAYARKWWFRLITEKLGV